MFYVTTYKIVSWIATSMAQRFVQDDNFTKTEITRVPAKRWGYPDDFKGVTCFLASHASDFISGAHIYIDGGVHNV